jgi:hypothetical protein
MSFIRMNRRSVLALSAAGAATMFLPDPRRGRGAARAQAADTSPLVITIEAANAWDPTFLTDPKVNAGFTPWSAGDIRTVPNTQIRYAPNLVAGVKSPYVVGATPTDFFQKHGQSLVVINGVNNDTVSHDIGPRVAFSGSNREGNPTLSGLVAAARGATLPLSLMTTGGFVNTEGLVPVTRASNVNVLLGLARSNIPNSGTTGSTRRFHDDGVFTLLRERVRLRDQRRLSAASVPREAAGIAKIAPARSVEVFDQFDELAAALDAASSVTSANPIIPKAAACMAAMAAGACAAAHFETSESFDTHDNHDVDHPVAMQELLEIIDFVLDTANNDPALASRGVLVVVGSDFGRTKYNPDGGKDHWPVTSMMIAAAGAATSLIEGGRVVGATDTQVNGSPSNGIVAQKVKEVAGDMVTTADDDPDGFVLSAGHVHLALREALGLTNDDVTSRFPLTTVVPQTPLPILKPA